MGCYYQTIVDRDASPEEAPALATKVVKMLIERGIIEDRLTDCVLGGPTGFPPGPCLADAVELNDDPDDPDFASVRRLRTNGLQVVIGKTVFYALQWDFTVLCAGCGVESDWDNPCLAWNEAVTEWWDGTGPGTLACPQCGHAEPLTDWESNWGFGYLGFTFWQWPPLREEFVAEISALLGHRVVVVVGKV